MSSGLLLNQEGDVVKEEMSDRKAVFKGKWEDVKERAEETVRFSERFLPSARMSHSCCLSFEQKCINSTFYINFSFTVSIEKSLRGLRQKKRNADFPPCVQRAHLHLFLHQL